MVAIIAAMADGTGLKRFKNLFPERFFDVGIAEEHAVTFAAGMAKAGLNRYLRCILPFYSVPMTRYYMMCVHRISRLCLP